MRVQIHGFSIVFVWYNQPDNRLGVFLMHCYLAVCIYTFYNSFYEHTYLVVMLSDHVNTIVDEEWAI